MTDRPPLVTATLTERGERETGIPAGTVVAGDEAMELPPGDPENGWVAIWETIDE